MHLTVDEFIRRANYDPPPRFVGTYHVTDDIGTYVNDPDVTHCVMSPDRPAVIISVFDQ